MDSPIPSLNGGGFQPPWQTDLPGVIGAGQQVNQDREHPSSGPPKAPEAPTCWPPQSPADMIAWSRFAFAHFLTDHYTRTLLRNFFHDTMDRRWVPSMLAPWYYPPFSSVPMSTIVTGQSSGAAGAYATIASVSCPMGAYGVVRRFGHDTSNTPGGTGGTDWSLLTWRFAYGPTGQTPMPYPGGYGGFGAQIGQVEAPTELFLFVPEGWTLYLQAASSGAAVSGLSAAMHGWYWEVRLPGAQKQASDHIAGIQR